MRNILLIPVVAALSASSAMAEQPGGDKLVIPPASGKVLPLKGAGAASGGSCADYGPGFAKVDGTGTCVKIGGAVRIDAGRSSGGR